MPSSVARVSARQARQAARPQVVGSWEVGLQEGPLPGVPGPQVVRALRQVRRGAAGAVGAGGCGAAGPGEGAGGVAGAGARGVAGAGGAPVSIPRARWSAGSAPNCWLTACQPVPNVALTSEIGRSVGYPA